MKTNPEQECCPKFDPIPWDDKLTEWNNKLFIKRNVLTFFYMPLNFGKAMKKVFKVVENSGVNFMDAMCLSDHTSKWNMDIYLAMNKEIPGENNVKLSGKFYSKVYEGPFKDTNKWCRDYEDIVKKKGLNIGKWYMWYTTCPKCAKKYGKNYVVIISELK